MTNAIIGYENHLRDGTVSADSEASGQPKENAYNWRLEDYWQPTPGNDCYIEVDLGAAAAIDYFAFYSSDLYAQAGATVKLYGDTTPAPTTLYGTITPTTRGPKLLTITSTSRRYWRIEFAQTGSYAPKIQLAALGVHLEFERGLRPGYAPAAMGTRYKQNTNESAGGIMLGRSLEIAPDNFKLSTDILTPSWVRANWPALRDHLDRYPAFVLPELDTYPDEAVIAWTATRPKPPAYTHSNLMSLALNLKAFQ